MPTLKGISVEMGIIKNHCFISTKQFKQANLLGIKQLRMQNFAGKKCNAHLA